MKIDISKIEWKPFSVREGDIEVRNFFNDKINFVGNKKNHAHFEIIKWYPNEHYGKWDEMLKNGWEEDELGLTQDNVSIGKSCFKNPKHCYTLAYWENLDSDEHIADLKFLGARPFELDMKEQEIFMRLAGIGQRIIDKYLYEND